MKKLIPVLLFLFPIVLIAQSDSEAAEAVVRKLFDGMRAADTAAMSSLFDPTARLQTTYVNKEGKAVLTGGSIDKWLESVGTPHEEVYDEQIFAYRTELDGRLASVWTEYTFYVGDKLSHCGVNAFQLFKSNDGWKIIQVTDTRRRNNCQEDPLRRIHSILDDWHKAAATADEKVFFGSMTEDAIYLGTDATERWLRDELREWSKEYFNKESAWAFTPSQREIYFSANKRTAWFEEALETGMGPCRGSGVLNLTEEGWKIVHYNLAFTLPNDKIEGFKKLIEEE